MKRIILVMLLAVFTAGCAATKNHPVKQTVDGLYELDQAVEQAVWDAM